MLAPKRLAGLPVLAPSRRLYAEADHAERITVGRRELELCLRAASGAWSARAARRPQLKSRYTVMVKLR